MLPIRFAGRLEPLRPGAFVVVDGCPIDADGPGGEEDLHLAHWPGNRTPEGLRRDLSTEIAFAFLDLPESERRAMLEGKEALVLNHFDTDGICALFVLVHPERARAHRELLNAVASAGDLFTASSGRAVAIDAALRNLADPAVSEFAAAVRCLESGERKQRLVLESLSVLGALLDDDGARPELWERDLARFEEDRAAVEAAAFDDLVYLDFGIWTGRDAPFDPGRHAVLADGRLDRALLLGPSSGGTTARFIVGTRSFFDVVSTRPSPRPDLAGLAAGLNEAERVDPDADHRWRAQPQDSATPEVWFGKPDLPLYTEHAGPWLAPSQLDPTVIKKHVTDAIRDAWVLPDDDDEAEDGEDIFAV